MRTQKCTVWRLSDLKGFSRALEIELRPTNDCLVVRVREGVDPVEIGIALEDVGPFASTLLEAVNTLRANHVIGDENG